MAIPILPFYLCMWTAITLIFILEVPLNYIFN
jgi:hypothetical protein